MPVVNDLSICVATANGSGSASSNNILFKSIFKMGIPCSSKNMFPSNIQGLPTWYQIRANANGYLGRKDVIDVMVMFNDATAAKDIHRVREGGLMVLESLELSAPKTKELVGVLGDLGLEGRSVLLVYDGDNRNLDLAARNLQRVRAVPLSALNVYDILACQYLLMTESATQALGERLGS